MDIRLAGAAGICFLIVGLSCGIYGRFRKEGAWLTKGMFLGSVLLFLVLSGASFTIAAVVPRAARGFFSQSEFSWLDVILGAIVGVSAYVVAWLFGRFKSRPWTDQAEKRIAPVDVLFWSLSGALVGVLAPRAWPSLQAAQAAQAARSSLPPCWA